MSNVPTDEEIVYTLNKLWQTDQIRYEEHVETLKGIGYRVFRNSKGDYKIDFNSNYFNEVFGGVFNQIFGGNV